MAGPAPYPSKGMALYDIISYREIPNTACYVALVAPPPYLSSGISLLPLSPGGELLALFFSCLPPLFPEKGILNYYTQCTIGPPEILWQLQLL